MAGSGMADGSPGGLVSTGGVDAVVVFGALSGTVVEAVERVVMVVDGEVVVVAAGAVVGVVTGSGTVVGTGRVVADLSGTGIVGGLVSPCCLA